MSIERDDEKCLHLWPQDRAAGGERVRRRTRCSRHHDAITTELRQRSPVDLDDDVHHAFPIRLLDGSLVQCPVLPDQRAVDGDLDVKREPLLNLVLAVGNLLHGPGKVGGLGLSEKADVAKVDAEQRNLSLASHLRCAQKRAVATEHDHRFGAARAVRCVWHHSSAGNGEITGFALKNTDVDRGLAQESGDFAGSGYCLGAAGVAHEQHASAHEGPSAMARARSLSSSGGAPARSHKKYSTFPAGPGSGLATTPRTPRPSTAAARATLATAAARTCGSR